MSAQPFPPACWQDIDAYDDAETVQGYLAYERGDPTPGGNHSPAYRWGWQNRARDDQHEDDGHDAVRHEYLRVWKRTRAGRAALAASTEDGRRGTGG